MDGVRLPAVAGTLYPAEADRLARAVDGMLAAPTTSLQRRPWGLVVPHAGHEYSGPIAASAYGALGPWAGEVARVALLGPSHFVPLEGCAASAASAWRTPLGDVPVDGELRDAALAAGCAADDGPHVPEHALEVQLPFLQRLLGSGLRVLPVAVGRGESAAVLAAIGSVADLVVVSTDLSHYHDAETARTLDRRTAEAIVARDPDGIGDGDACGAHALRAALALARAERRPIELLDLRTSADTAGGRDRVVGYGALAIGERGTA